MIRLVDVTVRGVSDLGPFEGSLAFAPGLQVISAHNRFGKSLAVTSIAWCLGLERMFGLQDNDPARFGVAVRDVIELGGQTNVQVRSSEASLTIERSDGARVRLTRAIKGDASEILVEEIASDGSALRSSRLFARTFTMKDETGGLQRFLFEWGSLKRTPIMNTRGEEAELYLERRVNEFTAQLRRFLRALGHGELLAQPTAEIRLDDRYVPYLGPRRLRSLGSASDQPRLVGAYTLALAAAATATDGLHPGFVVLDEPLQQNPEVPHRELFIDFLTSDFLRATKVQTIIFTWLQEPELQRLIEAGVPLVNPREHHFLALVPQATESDANAGSIDGKEATPTEPTNDEENTQR